VKKPGLLVDEGEDIPLNRKSVLAGYLRNGLFCVLCLGFAMAFDGLFLNSTVERDRPSLVAQGTAIFVTASLLWLWAMFVLGAKPGPVAFSGSSGRKLAGGLLGLMAVLVLLFGTASLLPQKPTPESIALDHTIPDEKAIQKLAGTVFPEGAEIITSGHEAGVNLQISYGMGHQQRESAILGILFRIKDVIQHGQSRNLSKIRVSAAITVAGRDGHLGQVEAYRVTIPREKFGDILEANATQELLLSPDRFLEQLGVVELDNFSGI
jgi:hypothetical protein